MAKLISTNPAKNYEVLGEVEISTNEEIKEKLDLANGVKIQWKETPIEERIGLLKPVYEKFKERKEEIAKLISNEIGKAYPQSLIEVNGALNKINWFFENVEKAISDEITYEDENSKHTLIYEPLGVAAVITPWNYPFSMPIWGIFPNLLVGNPVILKVSEENPLVGKLIEEVFEESNLPKGVFSEIYGSGTEGSKLVNGDIGTIWFTGSTKTGKKLYEIAASKFIKVILEMGGSNPCIVFEDVEISDEVVETIFNNRFRNNGQVCDAIKRLIVHKDIYQEILEKLKTKLKKVTFGDPFGDYYNGSLVSKKQMDLLESQVKDALNKGAKLEGENEKNMNLKGAYFEPMIFSNINKNMKLWQEEVFGPVLPIIKFETEEEAIELANDTPYGLGSRVISCDKIRAWRVASKIDSGVVDVNFGNHWLSCNPFGGYKQSGVGREHGILGFKELTQVKVISESK